MRSRSGTVTPTSNHAGVGITPQIHVKGVDHKLVQIIMDEIVEGGAKVRWSDIAGQDVSWEFSYLSQPRIGNNYFELIGCETSSSGDGNFASRTAGTIYWSAFTG